MKSLAKWGTTLSGMLLAGVLFSGGLLTEATYAQSSGVPWPASDALGRIVDTADGTGTIRQNKTVGIFYFLWLSEPGTKAPWQDGPYDVSKILEQLPEEERKNPELSKSELWAPPESAAYFWGEPLFGYYSMKDPWVLRKHMQLLADAGVDFIIFDTTNFLTYPETVRALCKVMKQIRAEGGKTPQMTFMVNTRAGETAEKLWNEVYGTGLYDELLFPLEGKPLLVCDPAQVTNPEIQEKLTLRRAHWPTEMVNTEKAWHWEAAYPQPYGWSTDPNKAEQVNVSVAQNLSRMPDAHVADMSSGMARGRSFCNGKIEEDLATDEGRNFAEQWKRAYELDPDVVMVTGWNEWIAGRWERGDGRSVFVDQFNREYSRDIEPMKGGHLDNYYMQMINGIRHYKGTLPLPKAPARRGIDISGDFGQWNDIDVCLEDHLGETIKRDYPGEGLTHYVNETGRNDLVAVKAVRDEKGFCFYLKTRDEIKPENLSGLCLLLNTDQNLNTGFIGGDVLIGKVYDGTNATLEKFDGENTEQWKWKNAGKVAYKTEKNELMIAVPYEVLGLTGENATFDHISFKWLDNFGGEMTPSDLYTTGDVAPESRFFFQLTEK